MPSPSHGDWYAASSSSSSGPVRSSYPYDPASAYSNEAYGGPPTIGASASFEGGSGAARYPPYYGYRGGAPLGGAPPSPMYASGGVPNSPRNGNKNSEMLPPSRGGAPQPPPQQQPPHSGYHWGYEGGEGAPSYPPSHGPPPGSSWYYPPPPPQHPNHKYHPHHPAYGAGPPQRPYERSPQDRDIRTVTSFPPPPGWYPPPPTSSSRSAASAPPSRKDYHSAPEPPRSPSPQPPAPHSTHPSRGYGKNHHAHTPASTPTFASPERSTRETAAVSSQHRRSTSPPTPRDPYYYGASGGGGGADDGTNTSRSSNYGYPPTDWPQPPRAPEAEASPYSPTPPTTYHIGNHSSASRKSSTSTPARAPSGREGPPVASNYRTPRERELDREREELLQQPRLAPSTPPSTELQKQQQQKTPKRQNLFRNKKNREDDNVEMPIRDASQKKKEGDPLSLLAKVSSAQQERHNEEQQKQQKVSATPPPASLLPPPRKQQQRSSQESQPPPSPLDRRPRVSPIISPKQRRDLEPMDEEDQRAERSAFASTGPPKPITPTGVNHYYHGTQAPGVPQPADSAGLPYPPGPDEPSGRYPRGPPNPPHPYYPSQQPPSAQQQPPYHPSQYNYRRGSSGEWDQYSSPALVEHASFDSSDSILSATGPDFGRGPRGRPPPYYYPPSQQRLQAPPTPYPYYPQEQAPPPNHSPYPPPYQQRPQTPPPHYYADEYGWPRQQPPPSPSSRAGEYPPRGPPPPRGPWGEYGSPSDPPPPQQLDPYYPPTPMYSGPPGGDAGGPPHPFSPPRGPGGGPPPPHHPHGPPPPGAAYGTSSRDGPPLLSHEGAPPGARKYAPYTYIQQPRMEAKTVLKKKFSWKNFPELERFLIANREDYLRHSSKNYTLEQKTYNNWLTERLLQVAEKHHYLFDPKDFNFVAIRDRIRCYYKSYVQTARKRGLPLPKIANSSSSNNPNNAAGGDSKSEEEDEFHDMEDDHPNDHDEESETLIDVKKMRIKENDENSERNSIKKEDSGNERENNIRSPDDKLSTSCMEVDEKLPKTVTPKESELKSRGKRETTPLNTASE